MAVPAHNKYTFSGSFYAASTKVESWQFRICTGPEVFADDAARLSRATSAKGLWDSWIKPLHRSDIALERVRVSQHLEGGLTSRNAAGGFNQADWTGSSLGSKAGAPMYPLQTSLAVGLSTDRAGVSGKGRFFLPQVGFALDTSFRLAVADQTTILTAVDGFLTGLRQLVIASGTQDDPCVVSSKGFRSKITGVRVGRVMDTHRSRRGELAEEYAYAAVV